MRAGHGRVSHASSDGQFATRPADGRSPTMLQKLAGLRSEPPRSLPSASATIPEHRVERLRARAELRHVRLAERDCARAALPRDDGAVDVRHVIAEERRAERRAHPAREERVLVRDRQTVERADPLAERVIPVGEPSRSPARRRCTNSVAERK